MDYRSKKLVVRVIEVKGNCPVYKLGDQFSVENGFVLTSSIPLCFHSLASLMPYYIALSRGLSPASLGIEGKAQGHEGRACLQCLDPCSYTGGGTVIFSISVEE